MWNTPLTVRSVATWDHVLEKLQSGADLMTPGLTSWHSEIKAGDITAIVLEDKVPVAVGVAAFDVGRLVQSRGGKGKAVYLVHCHHDELWALGNKMDPPSQPPNDPTVEVLETSTQQLSLDEMDKIDGDKSTEKGNEESPPAEEITQPEEKISPEPSTAGTCLPCLP
jgi:predicted RNA-binding protein (TIGR00451 family)